MVSDFDDVQKRVDLFPNRQDSKYRSTNIISNLNSSINCVRLERISIGTVRHRVSLHPLVIISPTLRGNHCDNFFSAKIHLNPLVLIISSDRPG